MSLATAPARNAVSVWVTYELLLFRAQAPMGQRYSTDIQNTSSNASTSHLSEVLCHDIDNMVQPRSFDFKVGLVDGRPAPKRTRNIVFRTVELDVDDELQVYVAKSARISLVAGCHTADVVPVRDGEGFGAGRVTLHCGGACIGLS